MTLSSDLMGLFALGVLWVNLILIVAAQLKRSREFGLFRARLLKAYDSNANGEFLAEGRLKGTCANLSFKQRGLRLSKKGVPTIVYRDQQSTCHLTAGSLLTSHGELQLPPLEGHSVRVWPSPQHLDQKNSSADSGFNQAYLEAKKAHGHLRSLSFELPPGSAVWAYGERKGACLRGSEKHPLIISEFNPIQWCQAMRWQLRTFCFLALSAGVAVTTLALTPPLFGPLSQLGAALCVLVFLLIQPLGVAASNRATAPDCSTVGGEVSAENNSPREVSVRHQLSLGKQSRFP